MEVMELTKFGFIYSRRVKRYFLLIDEYNSGFDIHDDYDINYIFMNIYAIKGNTPVYVGKYNIIMHAHVRSSPTSSWHTFREEISYHGTEGTYNKFLEMEWKEFVKKENIVCSEEPVSSDSDSDSDSE